MNWSEFEAGHAVVFDVDVVGGEYQENIRDQALSVFIKAFRGGLAATVDRRGTDSMEKIEQRG
ncbi:MAG: hypothetical protein ACLU4N_06570 [Butyricimonas faecihominis]